MGIEVNTHMLTNIDLSLEPQPKLEHFWNLESIGIKKSPIVVDDDRALDNFNKTTEFTDGRYLVTWPWKESSPDNYQLAVGRLKFTVQRLRKDPCLLKMYTDVIQDQLDRGVIKRVSSDIKESIAKHYIPYHAVITPSKTTTKLRVVYDASVKSRQTDRQKYKRMSLSRPSYFTQLIWAPYKIQIVSYCHSCRC